MSAIQSPCNDPKWDQSLGEELANSISHGVGLVAGLIGAPILMFAAWRGGDRYFFIGAAVFSAAMLLVYLGSTLYHAWPRGAIKSVFQVIDHSAIFLLIAGTYTPFTLGPLRGAWGWTILVLVWALAIFGVILKSVHGTEKRKGLSMTLYLGMGWLVSDRLSAAYSRTCRNPQPRLAGRRRSSPTPAAFFFSSANGAATPISSGICLFSSAPPAIFSPSSPALPHEHFA